VNIVWFLDKEFDVSMSTSGRLSTITQLEKNHDVTIVTTFKKEKKAILEIKSKLAYLNKINLPLVKTLSLYHQHLKYLNNNINLGEYDTVFVNSNNYFLLRKLIEKTNSYNLKLIFDIRTLPVDSNPIKKGIKEFFFKKALKIAASDFDGITYITEEMRRYCARKYNLPKHKSTVWSSGVDIELFRPLNKFSNGSNFRIMYHGAISKKRGIINVVRAINELREYDIEFFLLCFEEETFELKRLVEKLRLEDKVHFLGAVSFSEVPEYINEVDAGIVPLPNWPGWNTSSPMKLFEYLACGKPVIVTRIPAHINVLDRSNFTFWAEDSTPKNLAFSILEAFKNKKHFQDLGKEARNFVEINFSWEKQTSKLQRFLEEIN